MNAIIPKINSLINEGNFERALLLLEQNQNLLPPILYGQKLCEIKKLDLNVVNLDILLFCHHTASYEANSGIQRVVRQIARQLFELPNVRLSCVCLNDDFSALTPLTDSQKQNFSKWSGPSLKDLNCKHHDFKPSLLLLPELFYSSFFGNEGINLDSIFQILLDASPRIVTLFYDNIPLVVEQYSPAAKAHEEYVNLVLKSSLIVPISKWAACDLLDYGVHHAGIQKNSLLQKIHPLPLAFTPIKADSNQIDLNLITKKLSGSKFILSIGSVVPHKNQLSLIQAFLLNKSLAKSSHKLVLAGNCIPGWVEYMQSLEEQDIIFLLMPSDSVIDYLYKHCEFVVFPSCEEGYGLPIIEAVSYGKPVISANFGVMDEVSNSLGSGVLKTDVSDISSLCDAISHLTANPNLLGDKESIRKSASIRSWDLYVNELIMLVQGALKSHDNSIYINVTFLVSHDFVTGIQRVILGIIRGLVDLGLMTKICPVCLSPSTGDFRHLNSAEYKRLSNFLSFELPISSDGSHFYPVHSSLFLNAEIDVIFSESPIEISEYIAKLAQDLNLTTAAIFYDAIPHLYPEIYGEDTKTRHEIYMQSLSNYHYIFPISHESSIDLQNYFKKSNKLPPSNLCPIHLAVDTPKTVKVSTDEVMNDILNAHDLSISQKNALESLFLKTSSCILYVSSIEDRKSQVDVAKAFISNYEYYSSQNISLIFVGRNMNPKYEEQLASICKDYPYILHLDSVSDFNLEFFYSKARFTTYCSQKEGFGLPVVESLIRKIPVLINYASSMRELCNSGGVFPVYELSVASLSKAMFKLSSEDSILYQLKKQLADYHAKDWQTYVSEMLDYMKPFPEDDTKVNLVQSINDSNLSIRSRDDFYSRNRNLNRVD